MKFLSAILMCFACMSFLGCGKEEATNTVEGVSQSEFDEYNRMLQESQAQMIQGDADAKAAGVADGRKQ